MLQFNWVVFMKYDKKDTARFIQEKLDGKSMLTYKEIASITGYHPKYILKLKKEILDGTIELEHRNKNKTSYKAIPKEEEEKIVSLYKRSNASVRRFCKFYGRRSYSCIYYILKKHGLLEKNQDNK